MSMLSFKEFSVLKEQLLLEAVDYKQMFTKLIDRHSDSDWADKTSDRYISMAQEYLKKNIRIVWFLKFVQWYVAYNSEQKEGMEPLYNKILNDLSKSTDKSPRELEKHLVQTNVPRSILTLYRHSLDLNLPQINDYNPTGKLPDEVFGFFNKIEKEWASELEGKISYSKQPLETNIDAGIIPIIDFGDGWYWVDLNTDSCSLESEAMGHCGDSGNSGSTLLSLRKLIKKSNNPSSWVWESHLTFELEEDCMLGQMKGKQNNKPESKYHDKIIALLTHKVTTSSNGDTGYYIKGLRGGGYKPETNFSLDDLTDEQAEQVITENPNLDIITLLKKEYGDRVVELTYKSGNMVRIEGFPVYATSSVGLDDLYKERRDGLSREFVERICQNEVYDNIVDLGYSDVDDIINNYNFKKEHVVIIESFLDEHYGDWKDDYDDWEDYVKENQPDEIVELLQRADLYCREASIQDNIYSSFKSAVNNSDYIIFEGGETFSFLFNTKRDAGLIRNLIENGSPNEDDRYADQEVFWEWSEPYYGWDESPTNTEFNEQLNYMIDELL